MAAQQAPRLGDLIEREAVRSLEAAGCTMGRPVMADKKGIGAPGDVPLTTNVYGLQMKHIDIYRYDVTISGVYVVRERDGTDKEVVIEFTKKSEFDYVVADRRVHCRDALYAFEDVHPDVVAGAECVYYDLQSILYSTKQLNLPELRYDSEQKRDIPFGEWDVPPPPADRFRRYHHLRVIIKGDKVIHMGDLTNITSDLDIMDRDLEQFLDIATSQWLFYNPNDHITFSAQSSYLYDPTGYGFNPADVCSFNEILGYLAVGAQKAVRIIEGPAEGSPGKSASIVVSTKKTPFHSSDILLSEKIKALSKNPAREVTKLDDHLKGIYVYTKHHRAGEPPRTRDLLVRGIIADTASTKTFEYTGNNVNLQGQSVTVQRYFREEYGIELREPNLPLMLSRGLGGKPTYHPSELCYIHDNQRIKTNQMLPSVTQTMIKKCAILPHSLREQNEKTVRSLHFWGENRWLASTQVNIARTPLTVKGRVLAPPLLEIATGGPQPVVNTDRGCTFMARNFTSAAQRTPECWVAYGFLEGRDYIDERLFNKFIDKFVEVANNRGLHLRQPSQRFLFQNSNREMMEEKLCNAYGNSATFALCVHNDTSDMHHHIKLTERFYEMITQCIRVSTLKNVIEKNQMLTLDNILQKTNVKLGGFNVSLKASLNDPRTALDPTVLYIGISTNHPGGGLGMDSKNKELPKEKDMDEIIDSGFLDEANEPPSVVGFSANYGTNDPIEFIGDFVYQPARREEKVDVIQTIVERCLQRFYEAHRNSNPKRVILFRNGVSEGMFSKVHKFEIPLVKLAIRKKTNLDIPLTVVVCNKISQNVRFFKQEIRQNDRGPDQNIRPGTVVDHTVVHPNFVEFYLNSHKTLQGTAKTPRYTVLFDENQYALQKIEKICYDLCYGYQIVYFPVSLPAPVYIADQYAKRGRNLYKFHMAHPGTQYNQTPTFSALTQELSFVNSVRLSGSRVNA